ncbi:MAG: Asp-tRNA(Asn)/Glu-tRNA(Gln) amidotransferase subunit GatB [Ruminococcaceae bacterium]|nr:Asp-tRNA(Asn)/Glu-tRNA(Gln) amidotransferase subunit GatB [Oscillospiraceae bacterium]
MNYEPVIGLEFHAELSTDTKIYCSCKNEFGQEVNTSCCPVCTGMPGTLPVLNKKVVDYAIKAGLALNCSITRRSKQDRKNYFYPDLPKAYQVSQFDLPLCTDGWVEIEVDGVKKRIGITRIHIEEDAGKLIHAPLGNASLVDFNRCGVPLIEIVSEPDLRSAKEARAYMETLKTILSYIGVSDCKMEEGSLRCDINVSLRPEGQDEFGTRTEMKNVSTFSGGERAIEYEIARQTEILNAGGTIDQETRRWDDVKGENVLLRSKEEAHDYRYFPEPDLMPIVVDEEWIQSIRAELPELPGVKKARYLAEYGITDYEAGLIVDNKEMAHFYEECIALGANPKTVANWVLGDISRFLKDAEMSFGQIPFGADRLCALIKEIDGGAISGTAGKKVLSAMFETAKTPAELIEELGLKQISDTSALEALVEQVIAANPQSLDDYKNGKTRALGFLVGQCMKESRGKGNPQVINQLVLQRLEAYKNA